MANKGFRYSDEEIRDLARANRGYGLDRIICEIYNMTPGRARMSVRFVDALKILQYHRDVTGEDLYDWVQDPEMTRMVTREEWNRITGNSPVPSGSGMSTSRTPKPDRKVGIGTNARGIPLKPQEFDWAGVVPHWERG